jgi:putative FmdB family regulatory protein
MPLYEYQCNACGVVFEKMQKFSDEPVTVHEDCGGAVRRLLSAPAFQFKGTGWYITDYARGKSGANGPAKQGEAKTESSAPKTDTPSTSGTTTSSGSSTPSTPTK